MSRHRKQRNYPLSTGNSQVSLETESMDLVKSVAYNVTQDFIVITRDKVELCLSKHVKTMEQRQAWLVPLGLCLAAVGALVTSNFHDWIGIKKDTWHALFIVCAAISGVACIVLLLKRGKAKTIDAVIDELMAQGTAKETLRSSSLIQESFINAIAQSAAARSRAESAAPQLPGGTQSSP